MRHQVRDLWEQEIFFLEKPEPDWSHSKGTVVLIPSNTTQPSTHTSALHGSSLQWKLVKFWKVSRSLDVRQRTYLQSTHLGKDLTCWREVNNISGSRADIKTRIRVRFYRKKGQKAGVVCSAVLLYEPLLHLPPHLKANKVFTTQCDTPPFQATMAIECTLSYSAYGAF